MAALYFPEIVPASHVLHIIQRLQTRQIEKGHDYAEGMLGAYAEALNAHCIGNESPVGLQKSKVQQILNDGLALGTSAEKVAYAIRHLAILYGLGLQKKSSD